MIYVVPGGTGNGSSWASGKDLAAALSGAASGSELWVKAGTYKPTTGTDRNATFQLRSGVVIYGGFAGGEMLRTQRNPDPATNGTILSGDIGVANNASDNSYHVTVGSGTDETAILDGFTVTAGYMDIVQEWGGRGGGMLNEGGSPTLVEPYL